MIAPLFGVTTAINRGREGARHNAIKQGAGGAKRVSFRKSRHDDARSTALVAIDRLSIPSTAHHRLVARAMLAALTPGVSSRNSGVVNKAEPQSVRRKAGFQPIDNTPAQSIWGCNAERFSFARHDSSARTIRYRDFVLRANVDYVNVNGIPPT